MAETTREPPSAGDESAHERRELFRSVRSVVIKVGTNVLARDSGGMALGRIHTIIDEIVDLVRAGYRAILVTSGAVSMGMHGLRRDERPPLLKEKQAYAAVGQIRLMSVYQQAFASAGIPVGQLLLTEDDFTQRERYLNLRNTINELLELGVIPIVNENDPVSTVEIEESAPRGASGVFGDNDKLSALVASKLGADLLLILTDVDGLYANGPPRPGEERPPLRVVPEINVAIQSMAGTGGARGRGGMATKLEAIKVAVQSGSLAVVANGRRGGTIRDVLAGSDVGTLFLPQRRLHSKKRWIAFASTTAGSVTANAGAVEAISHRNKSLLFAGVTAINAPFRKGDVIAIVGENGAEVARGIANMDSSEAQPLLGKRSEEIVEISGRNYVELVHRDNLVVRK